MTGDEIIQSKQPWPADELEAVAACPFCQAEERHPAYVQLEDWTFACAPGKWDYWRCDRCHTLYLDPRPTAAAIGKAYARYYTHAGSMLSSFKERLKSALRHTCYLAWYGIALRPRIPWPQLLRPLLSPLRRQLAEPFLPLALNRLPRGRLMDVGCGNGGNLLAARQLGWSVQGIEIDPQAAAAARALQLDVIVGDYRCLADFSGEFDCLICSHVIEHVHAPLELLRALHAALKSGGVALICLPNAESAVLEIVGENWRGLEAPRHLAIPTWRHMIQLTTSMGFVVEASSASPWATLDESLAIARRRESAERMQRIEAAVAARMEVAPEQSDFINLVLKKK
jgi:SAM-dependent methyltransferase